MTESSRSTEINKRLHEVLSHKDTLSCEAAEALIPELVQAEAQGEVVSEDPRFEALLRHLDHCESCLDHYEALAEAYEQLVLAETDLPVVAMPAPNFFSSPLQKGPYLLLHQLLGSIRRFRLDVTIPPPRSTVPVLSMAQQILYSDRLVEVDGKPLCVITVEQTAEGRSLLVMVRASEGKVHRWQISLHHDHGSQSITTDELGVVRLHLPDVVDLATVQVICEELPDS